MSLRLSPSLAKILIQKGPASAYLEATKPRGQSPVRTSSMRFGATVDRLVFGVGDEIVIKSARFQPEHERQLLVTEKVLEHAKTVAGAVHSAGFFPVSSQLDNGKNSGDYQRKLAWFDKELGIELVAKPDAIFVGLELGQDLKTTRDISDHAITRDIRLYGYDIQAAAYMDAMGQHLGWLSPGFNFVFVHTTEPYTVKQRGLGSEELSRGKQLWQTAKATWTDCLRSGNWPDQPIEAPEIRPRYDKKKHNAWLIK